MKLILLGTTGLLFASLAVAQTPAPRQADRGQHRAEAFAASDSNRDGKLSLAEFERARSQRIAEHFKRLDVNHDGSLTQDELRQQRAMRASRKHARMAMHERLRALDANGDRALSRAEIGTQAPKLSEHFDDFDLDRDGRLTGEEMRAGRKALRLAR